MSELHDPEKFKIETDPLAPDFVMLANIIRELKTLGYDDLTSARFARLIGSTPIVDADGRILVIENTEILAKIKLKLFPNTSRPKSL